MGTPLLQPEPEPVPPPVQFTLGSETGNFGQAIEHPVVQPELPVGYSCSGLPKAEKHSAVPATAPYYVDRCTGCSGKMWCRDPREDICEDCAARLRDDFHGARMSMESRAGGVLVNPL